MFCTGYELIGLMALLWMVPAFLWTAAAVWAIALAPDHIDIGVPYLFWSCLNMVVSILATVFMLWVVGQITAAC